jgi:hypothetical protein
MQFPLVSIQAEFQTKIARQLRPIQVSTATAPCGKFGLISCKVPRFFDQAEQRSDSRVHSVLKKKVTYNMGIIMMAGGT